MEKFVLALFLSFAVVQGNEDLVMTVLIQVGDNHLAQELTFAKANAEYIHIPDKGYVIPVGLILKKWKKQKTIDGNVTFRNCVQAKIKMEKSTHFLDTERIKSVLEEKAEEENKLNLMCAAKKGEKATFLATVPKPEYDNDEKQWIFLKCKTLTEFKKPERLNLNNGDQTQDEGDICLTIPVYYKVDDDTFAYEVKLISSDTKQEVFDIGGNRYVYPAALVAEKLGLELRQVEERKGFQVSIKGKKSFLEDESFLPHIYEFKETDEGETVQTGVKLIYRPEEKMEMVTIGTVPNAVSQDQGWRLIGFECLSEDITPQSQTTNKEDP